MQAISQLATRTYQARRRQAPSGDAVSTCSSAPVCAICLEEFNEGQVRAVPLEWPQTEPLATLAYAPLDTLPEALSCCSAQPGTKGEAPKV